MNQDISQPQPRFLFYFFKLRLCMHVRAHVYAVTHVGRSVDSSCESVLSFSHVGSQDEARVVRFGGKCSSYPSYR